MCGFRVSYHRWISRVGHHGGIHVRPLWGTSVGGSRMGNHGRNQSGYLGEDQGGS